MRKTQVLAYYLPQFHEIDENNAWWGKGFTEWVNVKKGKPLYQGHYQPKVQLNKKYYNLLDIRTLREQTELAQKYGVDGFCYYHYWFSGKLLLEKPAQLLLENKDINISFCFSWANETWSRRWNGADKDILIQQSYGGESEWDAHLDYLIPYFKDERYIKIDNKPVLLLYRAFEIPECDRMIEVWNHKLKQEGFSGIYIIETLNTVQTKWILKQSEACVEFEPMYTLYKNRKYRIIHRTYRYFVGKFRLYNIFEFTRRFVDYDRIWRKILARKQTGGKKVFLGAFPNWDNTARRGNSAVVFRGSSPEKFKCYFTEQYRKSVALENEFIFINAWNEWGEGAYLEPDEKYLFQYLEAVRYAREQVQGV